MNNDKTGGAAFPLESDYGSQRGMTLRDYFAGQVISELLVRFTEPDIAARLAYHAAEAMIEQRAKRGE
jgi:hypothetical protein